MCTPVFNLYNRQWPILGHLPPLPPAKFVLSGSSLSPWWVQVRSSPVPAFATRFSALTHVNEGNVRRGDSHQPGYSDRSWCGVATQ